MALQQIAPGVYLSPTPTMTPTPQNYITETEYNLLTPYIPDLDPHIFNQYGTQLITGLIEKEARELPLSADMIKWTEGGRISELAIGVARSGNVFTTTAAHSFIKDETIVVRTADGSVLKQGQITATTSTTFTALGDGVAWAGLPTTGLMVYADSNEFGKGTAGMTASRNAQTTTYTNQPTHIKAMIKESRSNLALRTWIEVQTPTGSGYLWYYKNYDNTVMVHKNAIENKLLLGRKWTGDLATSGKQGTEGLFQAAEQGNVFEGPVTDLDDVQSMVERYNSVGMITENYMYCTSSQKMLLDRFIKKENETGHSWGAFNNGQKGAFELGFDGFRHGSYSFYPTTLRFFDSPTGEGSATGATKKHFITIPSGSKNAYDVIKGEAATNPMLNVRYRAGDKINKKYEISVRDWAAGNTNGVDEMITDFQTERCLQVQGRINLMVGIG